MVNFPLGYGHESFATISSSCTMSVMSTSRGFAPRVGPTIPARSNWSIRRPARLYPMENLRWMSDVEPC